MSVDGWERTPNALIVAELSDRALGLWVRMRARQGLGEPLSAAAMGGPGREGRDARQAAMRELAAAGLLHTVAIAGGDRGMRKVTRVYDEPTSPDVARADILERSKTGSQASSSVHSRPDSQASEIQAIKTYIPTTTDPLPPTHSRPDSQASSSQASSRRRTVPTCPTCLEDHYPAAACADSALLLPVVVAARKRGGPTRGRGNRWSATARRTGTG